MRAADNEPEKRFRTAVVSGVGPPGNQAGPREQELLDCKEENILNYTCGSLDLVEDDLRVIAEERNDSSFFDSIILGRSRTTTSCNPSSVTPRTTILEEQLQIRSSSSSTTSTTLRL